MISNAFWPDSFLPVKRMVEDGDVCITKYVSLIGVIIHSSLRELRRVESQVQHHLEQ